MEFSWNINNVFRSYLSPPMILKNIFLFYPVCLFMCPGTCVVTVCVEKHLEI